MGQDPLDSKVHCDYKQISECKCKENENENEMEMEIGMAIAQWRDELQMQQFVQPRA